MQKDSNSWQDTLQGLFCIYFYQFYWYNIFSFYNDQCLREANISYFYPFLLFEPSLKILACIALNCHPPLQQKHR